MKEIALTKAKAAIVDDEDYERIVNSGYSWQARYSKSYWTLRGVKNVNGKSCSVGLARFILGVTDRNIEVDHIDCDPFNNQRSNLRLATRQQNKFNRKKSPKSKALFKGVYYDKMKNRWHARIFKNKKRCCLGLFKTPEEAARAYDAAAKEFYGEFARLNFE